MRLAGGKESTLWEWLILFTLMAVAVTITEWAGVSQKWEDAVVYTVVLFTTVIIALRPAWGRLTLWQNLIPVFALHALAIVIMVQSFSWGARGIPKLPLIGVGMIEGFLILAALWRRTVRSKSNRRSQ
jgi:hypothetical protein